MREQICDKCQSYLGLICRGNEPDCEFCDQILSLFRQRIEQMQVLSPDEVNAEVKKWEHNENDERPFSEVLVEAQLAKCREDALKGV